MKFNYGSGPLFLTQFCFPKNIRTLFVFEAWKGKSPACKSCQDLWFWHICGEGTE